MGLLDGLLPGIYSAGDTAKRKIRGLLDDPSGTIAQSIGNENDRAGQFNQLTRSATDEMVNRIRNGGGMGANEQRLAGLLADAYNPAGMIVYHGSGASKPIKEISSGGVFGGLFTSPSKQSANSHGDKLYRMTVKDEAVMPVDADLPFDDVAAFVKSKLRPTEYSDDIADLALSGRKGLFDAQIPEEDAINALRASDLGEADWALQNLRGQIAKKFGFKAVEMPDEHGMSYLVLPGTKPRPYNEEAKTAYRAGLLK